MIMSPAASNAASNMLSQPVATANAMPATIPKAASAGP